ncbi:helix-turn-helix transcriptional regulator [Amycolatopsis sp. NPDC051071]|uniref:helix-turn-helix transcriptional regulator n=1 Tax=Amycolatopsis sp. NPDC051071 TaxID=3154637 RepID=UPI0034324FE1
MTERDDQVHTDADRDYWATEGYEGYVAGMAQDEGVPYITGRVPLKILKQFTREQLMQELEAAYYTYEGLLGEETRHRNIWDHSSLEVSKAKPTRKDFEEYEEVLSSKIRQLRTDRGWSQEDLANHLERVGFKMHQTTIAKLESGKRPIRASEVFALSYVFRIPMEALWSLPTPGEPAPLSKMREEFDELSSELREAETELRIANMRIRELQEHKHYLAWRMNEAATTTPEDRRTANLELHLRKLDLPPRENLAEGGRDSGWLVEYAAQRDRVARAILKVEEVSAHRGISSDENEVLRRAALDKFSEAVTDARLSLERHRRSQRLIANSKVELTTSDKKLFEHVNRENLLLAQERLKRASVREERAYEKFDRLRNELAKADSDSEREALQPQLEIAEEDYKSAITQLQIATEVLHKMEENRESE